MTILEINLFLTQATCRKWILVGRFKRMVNRNQNKKSRGHAQQDGQSSGSRNKLWRRPESSYKVQSDEEEQGTQLCEATELVHETKKTIVHPGNIL